LRRLDRSRIILGYLLLFLDLLRFRVAVEVQIHNDVPLDLTVGKSTTQTQHLTSQHPPDQPNSMATLVVCWNGDVDELGWGIGVAESNDGDVDVGGLLDGLGVGARVGDDNEAGFLEGAGDVVGEVTGSEATGDRDGSSVGSELEDGALTVGAGGDDADVGWVVDGGDDAGCEDDFLPGLVLVEMCS
jgi:hypothetical protein